eukprot:NODE_50_length_27150_cov_0.307308.p16 type:complete len:122 gc:universal NODE_50_length_27150_cov_0.307308:7191-6826(-)
MLVARIGIRYFQMLRGGPKFKLKDILKERALNSIRNDPKGLSQNEVLSQLHHLEQGDRDWWKNFASFLQTVSGFAGACAIAYFSWLSFEKGKASDHFKWIYDHHFGAQTHGESSKAMKGEV